MKALGAIPRAPTLLAVTTALGLVLHGTPAGIALYPLLGVIPGLAVAEALPLAAGPLARWALALAVAPLVSAISAWLLMQAGLSLPAAARATALLAGLAWLALRWRARRAAAVADPGDARFAAWFSAGAGAVIAAVVLLNPWIRVRGDAWIHTGIVWQILGRGIPPEDPRFAGLPLQYVWFFNFFVALLTSFGAGDPFLFMALANVATMVGTLLIAWLLGQGLWGDARAARGAVLLSAFGFNAGMWMLWPLRLVRALVGHDRGPAEALATLRASHWHDAYVIFELNAPFAYMVSFLDKFLHGTALAYTYLLMSLFLWSWLEWFGAGRRSALVWATAAACGMLLFHAVVGLSVIPVGLAVLAVAWVARHRAAWMPPPGRLAAPAGATLLGALAAAPYTIAITRGWPAGRSGIRHAYLAVDPLLIWTMVSALAVTLWVARRPLREALAARRQGPALLALFAAGMAAFTTVVSLPLGNSIKFVYQVFVPLAALGGAALADELAAWTRRIGWPAARLVFALVFLGAPALTVAGYLADAEGRRSPQMSPGPAERALYDWTRRETPVDAVFVDGGYRDLLMVHARRQLLLGSTQGTERAAFPRDQVEVRRAVMSDLYGPLAEAGRDVRLLASLGRPAYVLARDADAAAGTKPPRPLERRPDLFQRVYDRDGLAVYRVRAAGDSATGR